MKKRFLAFLLAVCVAVSMLVLPASAVGSNAAVQTATALGGLTAEQSASLGAPLTRGQAARLLTAFSAYRDTAAAQGRTGRLYSDVDSDSPYAVYIRTAVQNGWMTGYSDGSFRPDNAVTLEEACTMALRLLGYDVASLGGTFPSAQLNKASALGLRNDISARQGEVLTLEQGTVLFYNALTAMNGSGQVYASTLGFAVSNGQVDISSVLLDNVKGPFVADAATALPFAPAAIYRNDEVTTSAALSPYDVYYYNESARTLWIYNKRAAGRVTAVSPSASAPTSVTVAGVSYTIASPSVAYQLSSLSGGGVGQVVTLLLGMNDAAVSVLTGDEADAVFYGVVQSSSRTLVETNSAEVQQAVSIMCTDGTARTVTLDAPGALTVPLRGLHSVTVEEVPVGSYTVTETDHPDLAGWYCTTTAAAAAGTVQVPSGGVGEAVITNTYAPFLRVTVTKQVTGGMGDTRRGFAFTAAIDGAAVNADTPYVQPYGGAALTADGFTIPHKGSIVIGHLKPGQTVTVTEETLTDYETTMDDGSNVTLGSSYTATLTGDAALTCVNNKDGVPPTGLAQDAAPAVWLLAAGAALAVVCRRRREAAP